MSKVSKELGKAKMCFLVSWVSFEAGFAEAPG